VVVWSSCNYWRGTSEAPTATQSPEQCHSQAALAHAIALKKDSLRWVTKQTVDSHNREGLQICENRSSFIMECDQDIGTSLLPLSLDADMCQIRR
jgi:hypothetical protein